MTTAVNGSAGGRTEAAEIGNRSQTSGVGGHELAVDSMRIFIPEELPGEIRRTIEENGPGMFRSVEVGLQDNDRFLLITVELSPTAARRGLRTSQTADFLRRVMSSYSPSPVPSNRWICEIALPEMQGSNQSAGLSGMT